MKVYECNGTNIFMRWKMKVPFNEAKQSWMVHFIFHRMKIFVPLDEWENIHYLFYITCKKDSNSRLNRFKRKPLKNYLSPWSKIFYNRRVQLHAECGKYYADACITLNTRTAPVAFAPRRVSYIVFLISLVLEQMSKDCIRNTEHSNINVNDECNSKYFLHSCWPKWSAIGCFATWFYK